MQEKRLRPPTSISFISFNSFNMSQTKAIFTFLLLAMIFSNIIESMEGRNIKFEDKNYFMKPNVHTMKSKRGFSVQKNEYESDSSPPGHVDGHSPGIGH